MKRIMLAALMLAAVNSVGCCCLGRQLGCAASAWEGCNSWNCCDDCCTGCYSLDCLWDGYCCDACPYNVAHVGCDRGCGGCGPQGCSTSCGPRSHWLSFGWFKSWCGFGGGCGCDDGCCGCGECYYGDEISVPGHRCDPCCHDQYVGPRASYGPIHGHGPAYGPGPVYAGSRGTGAVVSGSPSTAPARPVQSGAVRQPPRRLPSGNGPTPAVAPYELGPGETLVEERFSEGQVQSNARPAPAARTASYPQGARPRSTAPIPMQRTPQHRNY